MKLIKSLWLIIGIIFLFWIYFFLIHPKIFKPKVIQIPNVINMSEEEAIKTLLDSNLSYNISYVEGKTDNVIDTSPKYGTKVYEKALVELIIEKHVLADCPNFIGLLYDANKGLIEEFCLDNNISYKVEYIDSDNYPNNTIIWQSKNAGEGLIEAEEITIRVCRDSSYFKMPNLVGLTIDEAIKQLDADAFNITIIYYESPIFENIVISQEIESGYLLKKNSKHNLRLYVSKATNDLESVNILDFCNILNELEYNYDIIYVDSFISDQIIAINYDWELLRYLIYVSS